MNKTFKKVLAVLLAALMVAFSVPFSALAAVVDDTTPDSGYKMHFYATAYDGKDAVLAQSNYYAENEAMMFYDVRNMTMADVEDNKNLFALVVTFEGDFYQAFATFDYDNDYITPAYYRTNSAVVAYESTTNNTYKTNCIKSLWSPEVDTTGTTAVHDPSGGLGAAYISVDGESLEAGRADFMGEREYAPDDAPGETLPGEIVAIFGFQLKQDCDLAEVIKVRPQNNFTAFNPTHDRTEDVCLYGNGENVVRDKVDSYFTIPELGVAPDDVPAPPTQDVYTYTFADGSTQDVKVDAGQAPIAPANTADTEFAHVADTTTHAKTTYSWVADGDKAFKEVGTTVTNNCDMQAVAGTAVEAGHLTDGKAADTKCSVCGYTETGAVIKAEGHKYVKTTVDPTCVAQGYDEYVCSVCEDSYKDNYTEATGVHTWVETGSTGATCVTPGTVSYECSVCKTTKTEDGTLGAHKLTAVAAVEATCENGGNDAYYTCDVCNKMFADADAKVELSAVPTTPAKGHSWVDVAAEPATCTEAGVEAGRYCSVCDAREGFAPIDVLGHDWKEVAEVPATRGEAGVAAGQICNRCDAEEGFAVIPALGVDITVVGSSLGTAAINGEAIANGTKNVAYESAYTLTATANDGAKFLGWKVGNKIVSTEATYTTNAYADMTYVPVFATVDSTDFTVTFVDNYGNVTATIDSKDLADLTALPEAPAFAGLTFTGWDMTLEEVKALTESATVTALYENDAEKTYTVTAPEGCTIVVDGAEVASPAAVTYNTLVTVKAEGATAWTVNGSATPAAYGAEYTFYCGSDITVAPVTDAVTAKPEVKAVSADKTATHQVTFLATRSVPEGFQLVESGFVYGKGMTAEDLVLENVGKTAGTANGTVKQVVCNNKGMDGQFSLTYGVKNMDASASAAAYLIYRDGGKSVVIYSDAMIYNY